MKILGIESSGLVASVALVENGSLKAEYTINNKMTHSQTLLPMLEDMMKLAGDDIKTVDVIGISAGPGSFTGLRIGAATAKGLALALNIPVIKISSLAAMAFQLSHGGANIICPIMDARRGQVYCAAYQMGICLIPEQAMSMEDFIAELNKLDIGENEYVFLGDGVPVQEGLIAEKLDGEYDFATAENNRQRGASVAVLAEKIYKRWLRENNITAEKVKELGADAINFFDETVMNSDEFIPEYLRKPQAEREKESGLLEDPGEHSLKKIAKGAVSGREKKTDAH
ncbi:MAG: tRNA (adenosine(37)-N6)-threonylcarbamoyltransferase complex dimerization subunit type 1 TsaB [Eubacteriales bacterium]|nr:tRNA (adenosine(37)-N6)-threonylcarbamoyltransferase complex dimerization subunit type 1 TsaB [Eubacteriales bacterium]